jgi:hypothetical protein
VTGATLGYTVTVVVGVGVTGVGVITVAVMVGVGSGVGVTVVVVTVGVGSELGLTVVVTVPETEIEGKIDELLEPEAEQPEMATKATTVMPPSPAAVIFARRAVRAADARPFI